MGYLIGFRSVKPEHTPDFLGIGAQKAGSTWLYRNLSKHPEVQMSSRKEIHYFDSHFFRGLGWYGSHFGNEPGRIRGEITPAYSILPPYRIRYIRKLFPDVKILLMIRNPIDRAWSRAKMGLMSRDGLNLEFDEIPDEVFIKNFRHKASVSRGTYSVIIDNWLREFPADQFFVGFFDDIIERPKQLLTDIFNFLGVAVPDDWSEYPVVERIYRGPSRPMPDRFRTFLQALYQDELARLERRLGEKVANWAS
jgi:hypothetical protein